VLYLLVTLGSYLSRDLSATVRPISPAYEDLALLSRTSIYVKLDFTFHLQPRVPTSLCSVTSSCHHPALATGAPVPTFELTPCRDATQRYQIRLGDVTLQIPTSAASHPLIVRLGLGDFLLHRVFGAILLAASLLAELGQETAGLAPRVIHARYVVARRASANALAIPYRALITKLGHAGPDERAAASNVGSTSI
jgi:hypothetical protein